MTSYLIFWLGMAWGMGRVAQKTQQNTQSTPNTDLGGSNYYYRVPPKAAPGTLPGTLGQF